MKLDYMPLAIVPLKNQNIAILGHVPWKGCQSKRILRIKDFNTGSEKEIWNEFEPYFTNTPLVSKFPHGGMMCRYVPYLHTMSLRFRLATSKNGNLIIASPQTGEVKEYDPDGKLLNKFNLNITPIKVTEEDIQEQYEQALKSFKKFEKSGLKSIERIDSIVRKVKLTDAERQEVLASYRKQVENFKDREYYPEHLPYFSSLINDSDGNLLVFEYTKAEDKQTNKFRAYAYDMKGNYLGTSSFKNDVFNLSFTPSTFQFYNGFVYAIANKKDDKNDPPQIVKMKLE